MVDFFNRTSSEEFNFADTVDYEVVRTNEAVLSAVDYLRKSPVLAVDTENSTLDPHKGWPLLIQIGTSDKCFVFDGWRKDLDLSPVKSLLENTEQVKIFFNAKYDWKWLYFHYNIAVRNVFCCQVAERLITVGKPNARRRPALRDVSEKYLGIKLRKEVRSKFINRDPEADPIGEAEYAYSAADVVLLPDIYYQQLLAIKDLQLEVVVDLENRALSALAEAEVTGVRVDKVKWMELIETAKQHHKEVSASIYECFQHVVPQQTLFSLPTFNIGSTAQLLKNLERLGFPLQNTEEATLKRYKNKHKVFEHLLTWRAYNTVLSRYGDKFLNRINKKTERLHCQFNQLEADCLPAGQLVLTNQGYIPVEQVRVADAVITHTGGVELVSDVYLNGVFPIYRTTLSNGLILRSTGNHPVRVGSGWVRADSLKAGDVVTVHSDAEVWTSAKGYDGYDVSSWGRVRETTSGRVLINTVLVKEGRGCSVVQLGGGEDAEKVAVHELVFSSFYPECDVSPGIAHKNGILWDNTLRNLDVCSVITSVPRYAADFFEAKVVSVVVEPPEMTYAISVSGSKSFVASGVVTHNTGRMSAERPNLQQVPGFDPDDPTSLDFRSCFKAKPGYRLITADFSQQELRILADMSQDPTFRKAYTELDAEGKALDVHRYTASVIFNTKYEEVTPKQRKQAKVLNFFLVYGGGAYSLAETLKIPEEEAQQIIDDYFKRYDKIKYFLDRCANSAVSKGYAETISGRKRFLTLPSPDDPFFKKARNSVKRQGKNCLDAETEALTKDRGWVKGFELKKDDTILTKNSQTGALEWQKLTDLKLFPKEEGTYVRLSWGGLEVVTTVDHRWLVHNTSSGEDYCRVTSDLSFSDQHLIHLSGNYSAPKNKTISDSLIKDVFFSVNADLIPDGRVIQSNFIFSLTAEQLVLALGEFTNLYSSIYKVHLTHFDVFQTICTLLGLQVEVLHREESFVYLNTAVVKFSAPLVSKDVFVGKVAVWCPIVPNTYFVARRQGKVFITGNTPIQGCLQADSRVLTKKGYRRIQDIYDSGMACSVWTGSSWAIAKAAYRGDWDLAEVELSNGTLVKCDTRHKFLTPTNHGYVWKSFSELQEGDFICGSLLPDPVDLSYAVNKNYFYWIGRFVFSAIQRTKPDYNVTKDEIIYYFNTGEEKQAEDCLLFWRSSEFSPVCRMEEKSDCTRLSIKSELLVEYLTKVGFITANLLSCVVSDCVFGWGTPQRKDFIAGMLSVTEGGYKASREDLQDIQLLLRTVGIESSISNSGDFYKLDIDQFAASCSLGFTEFHAGLRDQRKVDQFILDDFISKYGGFIPKSATTRDRELLQYIYSGGSIGIYSFQRLAARLGMDTLPLYTYYTCCNKRVLHKKGPTYTMSMSDPLHRFDASGVITHNSGSDVTKMALVFLYERLKKEGYDATILMVVHDEFVVEVVEEQAEEVARIVEEEMVRGFTHFFKSIPMIVDANIGDTWEK